MRAFQLTYYDKLGRVSLRSEKQIAGVSSPADLDISYTYDRSSRLTELVDPQGGTSRFTYDAFGRLKLRDTPGPENRVASIHETFRYDDLGRTILRGDPEGSWAYSYAPNSARLVSADYQCRAATPECAMSTTYSYNLLGNLEEATRLDRGVSVTTTRQHDGWGRVIDERTALPHAAYDVAFDYGPDARLADLLVSDVSANPVDDVGLSFTYAGPFLSQVDGRRTSTGGVTTPVYHFEQGYDAWSRVEKRFAYDGVDVTSAPTWTNWSLQLDPAGRPMRTDLYVGDGALDVDLVATQERFYGRDHRVIGDVRTWETGMGPSYGKLQVAAYDTMRRLKGLRSSEVIASGTHSGQSETNATIDGWRTWLSNTHNTARLQNPQVDPQQTTSSATLGGQWTAYTRNDLGTLLSETVDGNQTWSASTYSSGAALQSVDMPDTTNIPMYWDQLGRAYVIDGHLYQWTGDDLPAKVQVMRPHASGASPLLDTEERIYDAFGRAVRIVQNGDSIDRVYVGSEVVREISECGERTWWLTGRLDEPAAYSVEWDATACPVSGLDATYDNRLRVLDLSYETVASLPELSQPGGATFGVVQDLHGDVIGVIDSQGRNLAEVRVDGPRSSLRTEYIQQTPWMSRATLRSQAGRRQRAPDTAARLAARAQPGALRDVVRRALGRAGGFGRGHAADAEPRGPRWWRCCRRRRGASWWWCLGSVWSFGCRDQPSAGEETPNKRLHKEHDSVGGKPQTQPEEEQSSRPSNLVEHTRPKGVS